MKFREDIYYWLLLTAVGLIVGYLAGDIYSRITERKCRSHWTESKYIDGACIVWHNNEWIPEQNIRVVKWINS